MAEPDRQSRPPFSLGRSLRDCGHSQAPALDKCIVMKCTALPPAPERGKADSLSGEGETLGGLDPWC